MWPSKALNAGLLLARLGVRSCCPAWFAERRTWAKVVEYPRSFTLVYYDRSTSAVPVPPAEAKGGRQGCEHAQWHLPLAHLVLQRAGEPFRGQGHALNAPTVD